jgi:hypothetical protein
LHGQVIINKTRRDTICQHSQCDSDLLDGGMVKLSRDLPLFLKNLLNFVRHSEKFSNNLIPVLKRREKYFSREMGSSTKYLRIDMLCSLIPSLCNFCHTKMEPICFGLLFACKAKIMKISSCLERSHLSSELGS